MKKLSKILTLTLLSTSLFAQEPTTVRKTIVGVEARKSDTNRIVYDSLGNPLRYYQYSKFLRAGTHTFKITQKPGTESRATLVRLSLKDMEERAKLMSTFNMPVGLNLQVNMPLDIKPLLFYSKKKELENKPIVLVFWNTGCWPCTELFEYINQFIENLPEKNFALLAVTGDNKQLASSTLNKFPFPSAKIVTDASSILQAYKLTTYPSFVVTDSNHMVKYTGSGTGVMGLFKAAIVEHTKKQ